MGERPILFSAPMVRALLSGEKTQTRRIAKPQPAHSCRYEMNGAGTHALHLAGPSDAPVCVPVRATSADHRLACPYEAGQSLWVRETWCPGDPWVDTSGYDHDPPSTIRYRADDGAIRYPNTSDAHAISTKGWSAPTRWRPAIHMPRWASRITLEVTGVRVERLQAITEADARAEGVDAVSIADVPRRGTLHHRDDFAQLWDRINGKRAAWASNPWVWVVSFKRVEPGEAR